MIKLTVFGSESTETMKKQNNSKDESQQKESTPLLVNKSKTLQHMPKTSISWKSVWTYFKSQIEFWNLKI